jgi:PAS domain S-box-containing protein
MSDPGAVQERIRKLAGEKANLQIILDLMNRIGRASGLQETIQNMLAAISETIGGTDSVLYYFVDDALFRASATCPAEKVVEVDDPLVRQVLEERKPLEIAGAFSATRMMMTPEFSKALTWLAPLMVGSELVGVIKVENLHMPATEIWPGLTTFVDFAAVVLKNEIVSQTRLRKANDELARLNAELVADIRKLQIAEADLRRATEEEQAVFNAATVGIILTRQHEIVRCNRTMERLFGYEAGELIGKSTRLLYPDDETYATVSEQLLADIADLGSFFDERMLVRKGGVRFWCRRMVQAIDRADLTRGFAGTFEDIAVERAALEEMARARAIAEEAATAKSRFLANMSHEIRTPMNAVIGMAHLAMNADPNPRVREYLTKIQSSSRHLLGIINDVLDFSKIEAGKMLIESVEFDLEKLVEDAIGLVAERAHEKSLELVVRIDKAVPSVLVGDPLRLGQILINYLNNAVKFTERGEILVDVRTAPDFAQEGLIFFYVRDSGIGLSEEQRGRLFHSFQQVDNSTTRKYGGTGLGLAIAKRLAEAMGGDVGVDSALGKGSTFWFSAHVALAKGKGRGAQAALDLRGKRILVVDDLEDAREVAKDILQSMGFVVTTAASGAQALGELDRAAAMADRYDLVLLDWKMPEIDGLTLAQMIRARAGERAPVVLMVTAYDRDQIAAAARDAGVREVLTKPITPSSLFNAIMNVLGRDARRHGDVGPRIVHDETDFAGVQALLVEDNEINQEVATELLKEIGLAVDVAADGAIAIEKARQGAYDVILMDLQMPVMDGVEATEKLRQDPRFARTPIIAMTASAMAADREKCLAAGMNDHIAKPIDPELLRRTLTKWLPDLAARQAARASAGAAAAETFPLEIDGLDIAGGLRRVSGKTELYLRLLRGFAAQHRDAPAMIAQAIGESRLQEAERLAHTVKGVAGNIGALAVQGAAEALDSALAEGRPPETLRDLVAALGVRVEALVTALDRMPPAPAAPVSAQGAREELDEICETLGRLLSDCDTQALDFLGDHVDVLRAAYPETFPELERSIERFDFEAALQTLRKARPA